MKTIKASLFLTIFFAARLLCAQNPTGFFYDPRDGQEYETVFITVEDEGGVDISLEWMKSNLNYASDNSYCYKNYEEYCNTFGRLYSWKGAMKACPPGWHLSLDREWRLVTNNYGGLDKTGPSIKEGGESGLSLQAAGFGEPNGTYIDVGVNGYYWKRTSNRSTTPGTITIHRGVQYITDDEVDETHRNSIRCVKDYKTTE